MRKIDCSNNMTQSQKLRNKEYFERNYRDRRELAIVIDGLRDLFHSFSYTQPELCVDYVDAILMAVGKVTEKRLRYKEGDKEDYEKSLLFACEVSKMMQPQDSFADRFHQHYKDKGRPLKY